MYNLDTRYSVVARLQAKLRRASSTQDDARYDRAINLALNPGRSADNIGFLHRNVVRDSGRTLNRQGVIDATEVMGDEDEYPDAARGEDLLLQEIFVGEIYAAIRERDPDAAAVLAAAADGASVDETATLLGLSVRRVRYLRTLAVAWARPLLQPPSPVSE